MLRYLRIAVSALGLAASVLVVAMWARSYWWLDRVSVGNGKSVASWDGRLLVNEVFNLNPAQPELVGGVASKKIAGRTISIWSYRTGGLVPVSVGKAVPYRLLLAATATLAAVPWIRRRYGLSSLLVAMTMAAVVLGLIATSL